MKIGLILAVCLLVRLHANIAGDYCSVLDEYDNFKTALDTFLAASDEVCSENTIRTDCAKIKQEFPGADDGIYRIKPNDTMESFLAYCEMSTGGWLVIQRRQNGEEDFYRTWFEYMDGFGNLSREFWLGNEKIHRLTSQGNYELRVEMTDAKGLQTFAEYSHFRVANMSEFYNLTVGGYSGNAGDKLSYHNNSRFSARNLDLDSNPGNCAQIYHSAWWYKSCYNSNLNGLYSSTSDTGIKWNNIKKKTTMKIRPVQ